MSDTVFRYLLLAVIAFLSICLTCIQVTLTVKCSSNVTCSIKPECREDGFRTTIMPDDGAIVKWLKTNKLPNGQKLSFSNSKEYCLNQSAALWQVKNQAEWIQLTQELGPGVPSFWLDATVADVDVCASGKECKKNESLVGQGLPLKWGGEHLATYSRLYRGETSEKKCIYVEEGTQQLWSTCYCELEEHEIVCLKRDCL